MAAKKLLNMASDEWRAIWIPSDSNAKSWTYTENKDFVKKIKIHLKRFVWGDFGNGSADTTKCRFAVFGTGVGTIFCCGFAWFDRL